jgi:HEAT repeat protein
MKITPEQRSGVIELLCQILLSDRDYRVRMQSSESLGKLQDPRAIAALTQAASEDPAFQVRISAVEALFLICSGRESIDPIAEQSENPMATDSGGDRSEMLQTNREQSTGFQINVSGGTVNINPPNSLD